MSGIVGIFQRDGEEVRPVDLQGMLAAISHRGRDAARIFCRGSAGFGNRLLWTTPESISEVLPRCSSCGTHMIAADARIDNRDDLVRALNPANSSRVLTDSELILAAYEKWGQACAEKLIGDFSFAIWDSFEQQLFCARDSAGVRPFYYYDSPELFAFASEIKALTTLAAVPSVLNEERAGDFLNFLFEHRSSTFYGGISRLPPASSLTATRGKLLIRRYWRPDPTREIRLRDDREYTEAFREKFDDAVRCRVRNVFSTGSSLSGGLDSSSIACTARNILASRDQETLHTFSLIFPGLPEKDLRVIDERSYIECVLRTGNFEPHYVRGDTLNPLHDWRSVHNCLDEANFAPNLYLHWAMYKAARDAGVRVFLDGLDGDTTVSHGFEYLQELARSLRWRELHKQGSLLARNLFRGARTSRVIWKYCIREMAPPWMRNAWSIAHGRYPNVAHSGAFARPQFLKRMNQGKNRAEGFASRPRTARQQHATALDLPLYGYMLEAADKAAAAFGLEARYPFFDRRLIEFCLALPPEQKLAGGWNRGVFRRAMEGVLPPEIQWRPGKGDLSPNFRAGLLKVNEALFDEIVSCTDGAFSQYVDVAAMRDSLRRYRASEDDPEVNLLGLFTAANLALWLEHTNIELPGAATKVPVRNIDTFSALRS